MKATNKKVWMMIVATIMLANVLSFAQNQQPQQGTLIQFSNSPGDMNKYLALPAEKRQAENKALLEMFGQLRLADVRDGLDWVGYFGFCSLDPKIRPLWASGCVVGIARTARYLPYEGPYPLERGDEYTRWQGRYYSVVCTYPWMDEIEEGDFAAIDLSGVNAGLMGSENTLRCLLKGLRGFVINGGGMRDTDEVIKSKVPCWNYFISQAMDQARIRFDAKDIPVSIGGVAIYPGDIIVADNDGVIVVPRGVAEEVYKYAARGLETDMITRGQLYEQLGWEKDDTVK